MKKNLRNLVATGLIAGSTLAGCVSCNVVKKTQGELKENLKSEKSEYTNKEREKEVEDWAHGVKHDTEKKDTLEVSEKKELNSINQSLAKRYAKTHSDINATTLQGILRSVETNGLKNIVIKVGDKLYEGYDVIDFDKVNTLHPNMANMYNYEITTTNGRSNKNFTGPTNYSEIVMSYYIDKIKQDGYHVKDTLRRSCGEFYVFENPKNKIQDEIIHAGYSPKRKLLLFREMVTIDQKNPDLLCLIAIVPEKNSVSNKIETPKPVIQEVKQDTHAETEAKINKIFDYGQKVIFADNSTRFKNQKVEEDLNKLYSILDANKGLQIIITGYYGGGHSSLPLERAKAVKSYLVKRGILSERIQDKGGKEKLSRSIKIEVLSTKQEYSPTEKIAQSAPVITEDNTKEILSEIKNKAIADKVDKKDFERYLEKIAESKEGEIIISKETGRYFTRVGTQVYYNTQGAEDEIWNELSDPDYIYLRVDGKFTKISPSFVQQAEDGKWYIFYNDKTYDTYGHETKSP